MLPMLSELFKRTAPVAGTPGISVEGTELMANAGTAYSSSQSSQADGDLHGQVQYLLW